MKPMTDAAADDLPDDQQERSPSGSPIYRHKDRTIPFQPAVGDGEVIEAVSEHIEKHLGPVESVYHEIISDLVHIDVHIVAPRGDRPFYTLVTSGLSEAPMTVPEGAEDFRFAEMMICLPPNWPLGLGVKDVAKGPLADENNYWPIRLLKATARMPHEYDTWLSYGHTLQGAESLEPYAPGTGLCSLILLPSMNVPQEFWSMTCDGRTTHFWSLYPLYAEELAFKMQNGADALWDKLEQAGITDILNPKRPNVCKRKKWFGLF